MTSYNRAATQKPAPHSLDHCDFGPVHYNGLGIAIESHPIDECRSRIFVALVLQYKQPKTMLSKNENNFNF